MFEERKEWQSKRKRGCREGLSHAGAHHQGWGHVFYEDECRETGWEAIVKAQVRGDCDLNRVVETEMVRSGQNWERLQS